MSKIDDDAWLYTISSKRKLIDFNFKEIWRYRDLLLLFVKRDVVTVYKQTILGPLWYLIQPLFTALTFTLIFNKVANIETGTVPPFLFNLVKFGIQLLIFIAFYIYYYINGAAIHVDGSMVFFPVLVLLMGLIGLGLGMIISSMVTKYRDLKFLVGFGVQLLIDLCC